MKNSNVDIRKKPFYLTAEQEQWVREIFASMSLEEKAGQLFCCMVQPDGQEKVKKLVMEGAVGAVLYRPVFTAEELSERFKELDSVSKIPLLKAANLEEGGSSAVRGGLRFSTQLGAAATGRKEDVTHLAHACAKAAADVGINLTFSPVADINFNFRNPITNVRTFGSDVQKVLESTQEYVEVLQNAGIAACAKHFPGDGVDFRDQHLHPTCNTMTAEEWYGTYGKVYRNLIEHDLLCIMAGHILQPAVQRENNSSLRDEDLLPASLSRELLTGVLREKFRFNGLVITDATIMNGYSMAMEREIAIPKSIQAGCDMICFSADIREDMRYILNGLKDGLLTEERLNEAVIRILALKAKTAIKVPMGLPAASLKEWAAGCADRAVTLVKDVKGILPVSKENYDKIRLICLGEDSTPDGSLRMMVKERLSEEGFAVEIYDPAEAVMTGTGELNRRILTFYICNMEARSNNTAVHIYWSPNHALDTPRFPKEMDYVFVSFSNPFHLVDVPRVPVYVNAYTASRIVVDAVVGKLTGKSSFKGVNPVDPFCDLFDTKL